jgi:glycosyltransferase involved in cell wall biosynthesis
MIINDRKDPANPMKEAPLVSVIIPVYNCAKYVAAAVESVLAQDYRPLQIIAVDDGSTDSSADIVRSFDQVEYRLQEHAGVSTALNTGVSMVKGALVAFLDADDLWTEGKLVKQIAALEADPDLSIVFGDVEQFRESGQGTERSPLGVYRGYFKSAMLIRRAALLEVGEFDVKWKLGDFIDWYARAEEHGLKVMLLPEVVAYRRVHETNNGVLLKKEKSEYAHVVKRLLDRRRAGADHASANSSVVAA